MTAPDPLRITVLLHRLGQGEPAAAEELLPLVYGELRRIASRHWEQRGGRAVSLQPTALVHEAWLRFSSQERDVGDRFEFFKLASRMMRAVLVDAARARAARKRGGAGRRVGLDPNLVPDRETPLDLLAVEEALQKLDRRDAALARLVELRFFAGLTNAETARVLECTERTVERRWRLARAFLHEELDG